jgi:hypothetical protein
MLRMAPQDEVGAGFTARNLPDGQITSPSADRLSSPFVKIFCFSEIANQSISLPIPSHTEGRFAIVTDVGTGCGGREWCF